MNASSLHNLQSNTDRYWVRWGKFRAILCSGLVSVLFLTSSPSYSSDPQNIDDLGFNAVTDVNLFSRSLQLSNASEIELDSLDEVFSVSTLIEAQTESIRGYDGGDTIDSLAFDYQSRGLDISRFSTTWSSGNNSLKLGSDYTSFQDLLAAPGQVDLFTTLQPAPVTDQMQWSNGQGFSIAYEQGFHYSDRNGKEQQSNPSLILSWQDESESGAGRYRFSALGTQLEADSVGSETGSDSGWGVNMAGGWQFGKLFAALSVTVGNGIDHLLLGRFQDDLPSSQELSQATHLQQGDALMINPRLTYSFRENSNFHIELNHYRSENIDNVGGIDTLDTIHLGYSWSPWPSTKFGVELMGKDVEGVQETESTRLTIGAEKSF